jgi:hypothetical protein
MTAVKVLRIGRARGIGSERCTLFAHAILDGGWRLLSAYLKYGEGGRKRRLKRAYADMTIEAMAS